MQLSKTYKWTRFPAEVLQEAAGVLFHDVKGKCRNRYVVEMDEGQWDHDTEEEFFADYRQSSGYAVLGKFSDKYGLHVHVFPDATTVQVEAASRDRIRRVFEVFERNREASKLPEPMRPTESKPVVFIGHGRSDAWRDLKDHLQDKHGIAVEAYEIGARAGHTVRDILQDMLANSSVAVLVMTAEDETAEGQYRARQNVVHEAGLFQGRLGFSRAILLVEKGIEPFSNIQGVEQIRFSSGNIKETFGEVLATLRREELMKSG